MRWHPEDTRQTIMTGVLIYKLCWSTHQKSCLTWRCKTMHHCQTAVIWIPKATQKFNHQQVSKTKPDTSWCSASEDKEGNLTSAAVTRSRWYFSWTDKIWRPPVTISSSPIYTQSLGQWVNASWLTIRHFLPHTDERRYQSVQQLQRYHIIGYTIRNKIFSTIFVGRTAPHDQNIFVPYQRGFNTRQIRFSLCSNQWKNCYWWYYLFIDFKATKGKIARIKPYTPTVLTILTL